MYFSVSLEDRDAASKSEVVKVVSSAILIIPYVVRWPIMFTWSLLMFNMVMNHFRKFIGKKGCKTGDLVWILVALIH